MQAIADITARSRAWKEPSFQMLLLACLTSLFFILMSPISAHAVEPSISENGAVIYAYHRIDEPEFPATNIHFEQFKAHIDEIVNGDYQVLPLGDIINAFKTGKQLPPRTLAITFEGGHRSILESAVPLLIEREIPFTVFFSVDQADWQSTSYLGWRDLKRLEARDFIDLGLHSATYSHLLEYDEDGMRKQINRAKLRFREEIGYEPSIFAYPFGETSLQAKKLVEDYGFEAALGQQSGVANNLSDIYLLPRFAMTESYGGLERFQLTANALPLKVKDVSPEDFHLGKNPPVVGFTLVEDYKNKSALACFATNEGDLDIEMISRRVEIRFDQPFTEGRGRVNCTMPAYFDENGRQRWRWYGMLFTIDRLELGSEDGMSTED